MKTDVLDTIKRLNRVTKRYASVINPNSHGRGQGNVLRLTMENEGISSKELAFLLDIRPPSLTDKLDKLELDGNVIRVRDKRDMRVSRIYITEKGRAAVSRREQEKGIISRDFSDCFSKEEKQLFCSLCERLASEMEHLAEEERVQRNNVIEMRLEKVVEKESNALSKA